MARTTSQKQRDIDHVLYALYGKELSEYNQFMTEILTHALILNATGSPSLVTIQGKAYGLNFFQRFIPSDQIIPIPASLEKAAIQFLTKNEIVHREMRKVQFYLIRLSNKYNSTHFFFSQIPAPIGTSTKTLFDPEPEYNLILKRMFLNS